MIVQVALDLPVRRLFEYRCEQPLTPTLGARVQVPLANAERFGLVFGLAETPTIDPAKLRNVNSILTDLPPLVPELVNFLIAAASRTQIPIGKLATAALPPAARRKLKLSDAPLVAREPVPAVMQQREPPEVIGVARNTMHATAKALEAGFGINLIFGGPGTGKLHIATETIAAAILRGNTCLVLVPSIAEVTTVAKVLKAELPGCAIGIYHSDLAATEQLHSWRAAQAGVFHVVVGTRSAVFAPLPDLGLICVLNENDTLYRAQRGLQYNARDLAAIRGKINDCQVLMTATTPSVELRHAAQTNRLQMSVLPKVAGTPAPAVEIVDIGGRRLFGGISVEMENALRRELSRDGCAVVLTHRRGRGGIIYCNECRHKLTCPTCNNILSLESSNVCLCRRCGFERRQPESCPGCGAKQLEILRAGSTRIAETLANLMPQARILRADSESKLAEVKETLATTGADIVVGTSTLLSLGLNPGTVIVSDADSLLHGRNYRAAEILFDMITKLTYQSTDPYLVVQTRFVEHHLFDALKRGSYETFAFGELKERKEVGLPPFRRLALLSATGEQEEDVAKFLGFARSTAQNLNSRRINIMENVTTSASDAAGKVSMQLLLNAMNRGVLQKLLNQWLPTLEQKTPKEVSWNIEVDPEVW